MNPCELLRERATIDAATTATILNVSERSLRAQLVPGGDLEGLVIRVGRRVLIKTSALMALLGCNDPPADGRKFGNAIEPCDQSTEERLQHPSTSGSVRLSQGTEAAAQTGEP